jgi:hypothetical protein
MDISFNADYYRQMVLAYIYKQKNIYHATVSGTAL